MRITYNETKTAVSYEWESFDEWFKEYTEWSKTDAGRRHFTAHVHDSDSYNMNWYGHADGFNATLQAIDSGWPELREALLKRMDGVELDLPVYPSMVTTRRRKRVWTDTGDEFSQQRAWNGNLDSAWRRPVRTERVQPNSKRITLAFDVVDNASVTNEQAVWRAALSLLLCDSLARAGRVFEVWCIESTSRPFIGDAPRSLWQGWCVKRSGEPVVLDRLAGMLSIGFLRTVGFMAEGMGPHTPTATLGSAAYQGLPHSLAERRAAGEVVLRLAGCHSKEAAIQQYKQAWIEIESQTGADRPELAVTDYGTQRDEQTV